MMDPKVIRAWGQIIVSVFALSALLMLAFFAFIYHLEAIQQIVAGAIVGYAMAVVQFYLGDSAGGQSKDEIISASNPPPPKPGATS